MGPLRQSAFMENSELLSRVRRRLSPDTQIEILASRSEYERYDGVRNVASLHGEMVGQLLSQIYRAVERTPRLDNSIKDCLSIASDMKNIEDIGDTYTARNWDGALRYLTREETSSSHISMIAVEDRGKLLSPKYYASSEENMAAIQDVERVLRFQLRVNPCGPHIVGNDTWFGKNVETLLSAQPNSKSPR
ncbi:hypothetical protein V1520DRAFT_372091 [Lipomyces starkeyi]